jgi:hypothetical protein
MESADLSTLLPLLDPLVFAETMQAIGNAVWRIQLLEEGVQNYLVTRYGVQEALAIEVAQSLLEEKRQRTLGRLVKELKGAPSVPDEISSRLGTFVADRNWLVHRSQAECRRALRTPGGHVEIRLRLEMIGDEATAIQGLMMEDMESELRNRGVSEADLLAAAKAELRSRYDS